MTDQAKMQTSTAIIVRNEAFLAEADRLKPELREKAVRPRQLVQIAADSTAVHGYRSKPVADAAELEERSFGRGESFILDFGDHRVGYLSFAIRTVGSPPDAPLKVKLTFGEMPVEVAVPFDTYDGWISSAWLQEETLFVDVMPHRVELPRRYSFRYVKVEVLATSQKYSVSFHDFACRTVTSADSGQVAPLRHADPVLEQLDRISIRTLEDCMQDVFEDGPKRDRRLWLGDLRLQALANYETFNQNDLVKRCLYLFAGVPDEKGRVSANLFIQPTVIADDTYLFDYSLFFTASLYDYFVATNDRQTLRELWPTAYRQVELALERVDETGILRDDESWWSFIDWNDQLNKQAPSQGVLLYTLKRAVQLAEAVGEPGIAAQLAETIATLTAATMRELWDSEQRFFVSGAQRQVSWAGQAWLALAEILPEADNRDLLLRLQAANPDVGMTTPYMVHHFVEALLIAGCKEEAIARMKAYWGQMAQDGADTFWELYDPQNKSFSPYGSPLINSYCHAWSCTPTYLIRRYGL
ncbi:sugar hydrolase [Paenibacillus methanolicus]|uniref:Alpha-L-rhamnosidase-like protein n=1 Tax=Paenibacillus methanolicus TaxID=582686 RepID=A0A5S5C1U7_9BACL|nr:sugar hydrolase [Paenibacillus methanolicus]TYP73139.1 alpha-L-rhamnosidase-like protein [Paenibacillus methanolicus]